MRWQSSQKLMNTRDLKSQLILIMEDNADDAWLLQRALRRLGLTTLHIVRDGQEGVAYLAGEGPYANRDRYPLPGFIITDLKMPRLNGLEVLVWLRKHEKLRLIPTLVLSSSRAERDVASAYGFGANSYLVKPSSFADLEKMGRVIRDYWESCEIPDAA